MAFPTKFILVVFFMLLPSLGFCMTGWRMYETPAFLLERPERGAPGQEVSLPKEVTITDSARSDGAYWYQVTVQGVTGWLFQDALFVQVGGDIENARVAKLAATLATTREALFEGIGPDESWVRRADVRVPATEDHADGKVMTWAAKDAVIQTLNLGDSVNELYFSTNTTQAARKFLDFAAVGLSAEELRAQLGEETSRVGSVLRYELAGGHVYFEFHLDQDLVTKVSYTFWPGNGMELPDRVYDLRRFRDAPGESWPQTAWPRGTNIRVREAPSLGAKIIAQISEGQTGSDGLVWYEKRDRGESWPWIGVELKTSSGTYEKGWIYAQFVELYESDERTYWNYVWDKIQYDFWIKTDLIKQRLGQPEKIDGWREKWPSLELDYQEFHDGEYSEKYLAGIKVLDESWDLTGIRIGDSMQSLQELVDSMLADRWQGDRKLQDGENIFSHEEGYNM